MRFEFWRSMSLSTGESDLSDDECEYPPEIRSRQIKHMESISADEEGEEAEEEEWVLYTEKEKRALELFREEVVSNFPDYYEVDTADHFLIRWLRARNLNIRRAANMLKSYYEWRATNELMPENWPDKNWVVPEIIEHEAKHKFLGFDKAGSPVVWIPIGRFRPKLAIELGLKDDCFKFIYSKIDEVLGYCEQARINTNGRRTKMVGIIDAAHLSWTQFSNLEIIQCGLKLVKEYEAYFPELLEACYVINVPYFFSFFFNMVAPLLSGTTLARIHIFDYNEAKWKPALRDAIPLDILPVEYGGEAEAVLACYDEQ